MKHMRLSNERKNLEADVSAFDSTWKGKMRGMPIMQILSKCHPLYRNDHAKKLKEAKEITEEEYKQFVGGAPSRVTFRMEDI